MRQTVDRRQHLNRFLAGGAMLLAAVAGRALAGAEPATAPAATAESERAGQLLVGTATISITPDKPVALHGQMYTRISRSVESPAMASVLALERRHGQQIVDQVIFVSCDLAVLRGGITQELRRRAKDRLPGFDMSKLVLNATHTHSAPVTIEGVYEIPKDGVMRPTEYFEFLLGRLTEAIEKAWQSRKPGSAGWGLGHAVVGHNRRSVYADGRAQMYGKTNRPDFRGIEGCEDHGVEVLFFWDRGGKLIATAVNVACPAQELESNLAVSADYWHQVRKRLHQRHGNDLVVLGWIGAAGDQSPHLMIRQKAEERMRQLQGLTPVEEIGRRIDQAWKEAYDAACKDVHADAMLAHKVQTIELPVRMVTAEEYARAKKEAASSKSAKVGWHQRVVARYERQKAGCQEPYSMELHVVRLGDVAIATNDFELFTDYGIQIKARSDAVQTIVIQLAGGGTYLPTDRAVRGGGYSAIVESNLVGPQGGQVLVERTLDLIHAMWAKSNAANPAPARQAASGRL